MREELQKKVDAAIARLKSFEPPEGYYLAFSGGKDSQTVYHLCMMAGVKFDAHYNVTSVDPPELVQFIKAHYPDAWNGREHTYNKDGKPNTMWNLIPKEGMPPTKMIRYCCETLKESCGKGRITVTGVRWAESVKRKKNQGVAVVRQVGKRAQKKLDDAGIEYQLDQRGSIVLNDDNDEARRTVEHCYRTRKTLVNPIIDWEDEDVWEFLNENSIPHCCLYDEGFSRLGCIGCPMGTIERHEKDFERWPKYKTFYHRAFQRMIDMRKKTEKELSWKNADEVMDWWINQGWEHRNE